jgi:hypothetical protein
MLQKYCKDLHLVLSDGDLNDLEGRLIFRTTYFLYDDWWQYN